MTYKQAKKTVQRLIKEKKKIFLSKKLEENIGEPKELWKNLKKLGLPKTKTPSSNICLKENNGFSFCSLSIANNFKEFFSNLAQNLIEKLPTGPNKCDINSVREFYKPLNLKGDPFHFTKVSEKTISDFLKELKTNKATGIDNLSGRFLKDGSKVLATPIAQICNLSIKLLTVPDECKIAKLKPLYKKGKKTDPKNYRPISLLPVISKILEEVIHDQTMDYVTKKIILYKFQSGFRKFHSADSCLTYLQVKVSKGFDSGLLTGMILIDLKKAFDTIDHKILIKKMKCMGFSNGVTKWFECYLSKRMFSVHVRNSFSDKAIIICGVPQGSILGPLLFLLYVNDMVQAVNCDILLYADDTGLIFQQKGINVIEHQLNRNFSNISDWFVDNKLSIHFGEDKTKSILFAPLNKCKKLRNLNISYGSLKIKQYSEVTYLGCILGESLSGESMALNIVSKINTRLKFLYRKNKFLSPQLRRLLCNALI